jgi:hypothetical protein
MNQGTSRAKRCAGDSPLERRVRRSPQVASAFADQGAHRTRASNPNSKGGGKTLERGCCDGDGQLAVPAIPWGTASASAPARTRLWSACSATYHHAMSGAWIHKRMVRKPAPNVRVKREAAA